MGLVQSRVERKCISDSPKKTDNIKSILPSFYLPNEKLNVIQKILSLSQCNGTPEKLIMVLFHLPCYALELSIHGICTFLLYPSYLIIACSLFPWYNKEAIQELEFFKTTLVVYAPKSRLAVKLTEDDFDKLIQLVKKRENRVNFVCAKEVPICLVENDEIIQTRGTIRLHNNLKNLISIAPLMLCTYFVDDVYNVKQIDKGPYKYYLPMHKLAFDLSFQSILQLPSPDKELTIKNNSKVNTSEFSSIDDKENDEIWNLFNEQSPSTTQGDTMIAEEISTVATLATPQDEWSRNYELSSTESPVSVSKKSTFKETKEKKDLKVYFSSVYPLYEVEFHTPTNKPSCNPIITRAFCCITALGKNCLSIMKDDKLKLLSRTSSGWSLCCTNDVLGWIPTAAVPEPSISEIKNFVATIRPVIVVQRKYLAKNSNELTVFQGDAVVFLSYPKSSYIRARIYGMPYREGQIPVICVQPFKHHSFRKRKPGNVCKSDFRRKWHPISNKKNLEKK